MEADPESQPGKDWKVTKDMPSSTGWSKKKFMM
jgi:hypothetical protein